MSGNYLLHVFILSTYCDLQKISNFKLSQAKPILLESMITSIHKLNKDILGHHQGCKLQYRISYTILYFPILYFFLSYTILFSGIVQYRMGFQVYPIPKTILFHEPLYLKYISFRGLPHKISNILRGISQLYGNQRLR